MIYENLREIGMAHDLVITLTYPKHGGLAILDWKGFIGNSLDFTSKQYGILNIIPGMIRPSKLGMVEKTIEHENSQPTLYDVGVPGVSENVVCLH